MLVTQGYSSLSSVFIQSPTNRRRLVEQGSVAPEKVASEKKAELAADSVVAKQNNDPRATVAFNNEYQAVAESPANPLDAEKRYAQAYSTLWQAKHSSNNKVSAYLETYNQTAIEALKDQFSFSAYA